MISYPLHFGVSAEAPSGTASTWETRAAQGPQPITLAIPPEFEGPGGGYSPEDLYAAALTNCFVATFKVFAEKSRLAYADLRVDAELTVDRDEGGRPWMSRVNFVVRLSGVEREDTARRLLERTSANCMILNSVKTEKAFEFHVTS